MKVRDYLRNVSPRELTKRLIKLDQAVCDIHSQGYYAVMDIADAEIIDDTLKLESFNNKLDYINSGLNTGGHAENLDFLQLCVLGLCAYYKVTYLYFSQAFVQFIIDDINSGNSKYLSADMPDVMREYYIDVFKRNNLDSLNNFLEVYLANDEMSDGMGNQKKLVKATEQGIKEAAYLKEQAKVKEESATGFASILLLPALLTLIYLLAIVVYFIFIK